MYVLVNPHWASALTPISHTMAFTFALDRPEHEWGRTWWRGPGSHGLGLDPACQPGPPYFSAIWLLGPRGKAPPVCLLVFQSSFKAQRRCRLLLKAFLDMSTWNDLHVALGVCLGNATRTANLRERQGTRLALPRLGTLSAGSVFPSVLLTSVRCCLGGIH